ncbi:MAG: hypothetical protein KDA74_05425 [Planctomycetaceae bacterium]|nr:hypothetical protein [Planctomycetaceae bacterium]
MRWHLIAGIVSSLFGLFLIAGGLMMLGSLVYYNLKYGPIEFSNGEYTALDNVALTWKNVLRGSSSLLTGMGICMAAVCWLKRKNRNGLILFFVSLAFSGITTAAIRNM